MTQQEVRDALDLALEKLHKSKDIFQYFRDCCEIEEKERSDWIRERAFEYARKHFTSPTSSTPEAP